MTQQTTVECGQCGALIPATRRPLECIACGWVAKSLDEVLSDDVPAGREETSRMAFAHVQSTGSRSTDARAIFDHLRTVGGDTCDHVEAALHMSHQTASARFNDLKRAGKITKTGERRPTRSGRKADVYAVTSRAFD